MYLISLLWLFRMHLITQYWHLRLYIQSQLRLLGQIRLLLQLRLPTPLKLFVLIIAERLLTLLELFVESTSI
ncbi:hypothetical protein AMATHDRAFT_70340 [Amanita thiersii Skay4041]|uniref:Uncharacterized protein n=1 Tax=Amanita thiersii Skay4041 TaxID=703135 RepID=A0A2A9NER7_9AGAR|nr:hypothetical protein AMATHDRAFT_70340 [Amanita thiersii Skay4041]